MSTPWHCIHCNRVNFYDATRCKNCSFPPLPDKSYRDLLFINSIAYQRLQNRGFLPPTVVELCIPSQDKTIGANGQGSGIEMTSFSHSRTTRMDAPFFAIPPQIPSDDGHDPTKPTREQTETIEEDETTGEVITTLKWSEPGIKYTRIETRRPLSDDYYNLSPMDRFDLSVALPEVVHKGLITETKTSEIVEADKIVIETRVIQEVIPSGALQYRRGWGIRSFLKHDTPVKVYYHGLSKICQFNPPYEYYRKWGHDYMRAVEHARAIEEAKIAEQQRAIEEARALQQALLAEQARVEELRRAEELRRMEERRMEELRREEELRRWKEQQYRKKRSGRRRNRYMGNYMRVTQTLATIMEGNDPCESGDVCGSSEVSSSSSHTNDEHHMCDSAAPVTVDDVRDYQYATDASSTHYGYCTDPSHNHCNYEYYQVIPEDAEFQLTSDGKFYYYLAIDGNYYYYAAPTVDYEYTAHEGQYDDQQHEQQHRQMDDRRQYEQRHHQEDDHRQSEQQRHQVDDQRQYDQQNGHTDDHRRNEQRNQQTDDHKRHKKQHNHTDDHKRRKHKKDRKNDQKRSDGHPDGHSDGENTSHASADAQPARAQPSCSPEEEITVVVVPDHGGDIPEEAQYQLIEKQAMKNENDDDLLPSYQDLVSPEEALAKKVEILKNLEDHSNQPPPAYKKQDDIKYVNPQGTLSHRDRCQLPIDQQILYENYSLFRLHDYPPDDPTLGLFDFDNDLNEFTLATLPQLEAKDVVEVVHHSCWICPMRSIKIRCVTLSALACIIFFALFLFMATSRPSNALGGLIVFPIATVISFACYLFTSSEITRLCALSGGTMHTSQERDSQIYSAIHTPSNDSTPLYDHLDLVKNGIPVIGYHADVRYGRRRQAQYIHETITFPVIRWKDISPPTAEIEREIFHKSSLFTYVSVEHHFQLSANQQEFYEQHMEFFKESLLTKGRVTITPFYNVRYVEAPRFYFLKFDLTSIPIVNQLMNRTINDIEEVTEYNELVTSKPEQLPPSGLGNHDLVQHPKFTRTLGRCFSNRYTLCCCLWTLCLPFCLYPCFKCSTRQVRVKTTKALQIGHPYVDQMYVDEQLTNNDKKLYEIIKTVNTYPSESSTT